MCVGNLGIEKSYQSAGYSYMQAVLYYITYQLQKVEPLVNRESTLVLDRGVFGAYSGLIIVFQRQADAPVHILGVLT